LPPDTGPAGGRIRVAPPTLNTAPARGCPIAGGPHGPTWQVRPARRRLRRTVDALGGSVDPTVVAEELQLRIDGIAAQMRVTPQTVLRSYIDDDWGQVTATAMMAEVKQRAAPTGPPEHLAVRVAARVLAALGQAMIYAAINKRPAATSTGPGSPPSRRSRVRSRAGHPRGPTQCPVRHRRRRHRRLVTHATLEVLRDQLASGAWTFCPCDEHHGQDATDAEVLAAVRADLLHLPPATDTTTRGPTA
jgi:hypothetical protein